MIFIFQKTVLPIAVGVTTSEKIACLSSENQYNKAIFKYQLCSVDWAVVSFSYPCSSSVVSTLLCPLRSCPNILQYLSNTTDRTVFKKCRNWLVTNARSSLHQNQEILNKMSPLFQLRTLCSLSLWSFQCSFTHNGKSTGNGLNVRSWNSGCIY